MTVDASVIAEPLKLYRSAPSRSKNARVDRNGGKYGAGIIYGVSLITEGEALGHGEWVDAEMSQSVTDLVNDGGRGVKGRWTHPSLSGDGLGKHLGRAFNARVEGKQSLADFHFTKAAHKTPNGDLAGYLMDAVDEDPESAAISIAFEHDPDAEAEFADEHSSEDGFASPDPLNVNNYRHVRVARLAATDFVGDPAANPGGMFEDTDKVAREADKLCAYALGLSDEKPAESFFDADTERVAAFAQRFLSNRGLILMSKEQETPPVVEPVVTVEQFNELSAQLAEATAKIAELSAKPDEDAIDPVKVEQERCRSLYAIAAKCGLDKSEELADKWIADGFSAVEAKASLADRLIAENGMSKGDGGQNESDPHAKFRAEFNAQAEELALYDITDVDAYIRSRCRDEGLPVPAKKAG